MAFYARSKAQEFRALVALRDKRGSSAAAQRPPAAEEDIVAEARRARGGVCGINAAGGENACPKMSSPFSKRSSRR